MIHISLFSGIGGFELAAEWMGWKNYVSCDINEFGNKVRAFYWPQAYHHKDIHTLNYETINNELSKRFGNDWRSEDIILTGGFPCQPFSVAGKKLGTEDDRHLWPEMCRLIREIRPRWIVGENVHGLVNWSGGLVFEQVQIDLENEGYEIFPFILLACAVNAPHRRDRVWFVAYSKNNGRCTKFKQWKENYTTEWSIQKCKKNGWNDVWAIPQRFTKRKFITNTEGKQSERFELREKYQTCRPKQGEFGGSYSEGVTTDSTSIRRDENDRIRNRESNEFNKINSIRNWQDFPTQSPVCDGDDGLSARLDGITFSKWRQESIKAGGNAIVPQVAYQIFKTINLYSK